MKYKMIVDDIPELILNGKKYKRGDEIMVVDLTEREATFANERKLEGCKFDPVDGDVKEEPKDGKKPNIALMSVDKLMAMAISVGVDLKGDEKKADLIKKIKEKENEGGVVA